MEDGLDFFEKKIRPVLVENCYKCHSAEADKNGKLEGKLRLDLREGARGKGESGLVAVVPGKPDKSNLYRAVTYLDSELVMPPKSRLAKSVVADFKQWIEMGAPDPRSGTLAKAEVKEINFEEARKFWSFRKPTEPKLPTVETSAWPREDLDHFILSQLEENGLTPAPATDKRILICRATYDLIGLPPTVAEIEAFLT
ncbi:MAG TPA: c-type cytochrome domain-containing protein, partial [Verrucomicrobiota bacterium]|nr:c-type cytochrome domain-containing protein [Verrucomicrobiota bacterium]